MGSDAPDDLVFSPAQRLQGERNPDSVLFRLDDLEPATSEPAPQERSPVLIIGEGGPRDASSTERASAGSTTSGRVPPGASGVIDLRRIVTRTPGASTGRERTSDAGSDSGTFSRPRAQLLKVALAGLVVLLLAWLLWSALG